MPSAEFWGVEVKPGQTVSCDPGKEFIIHLSQAALGETKEGSVSVVVSAKVDDNRVVIGVLSSENFPQILFDLVFEKEFELSHSSEAASVFVCGYKVAMPDLPESDSSKDKVGLKTVNNQVINPIADEDDSDTSSLDDLSSYDGLTEDESSSEEIDTSSEEIATSSEEDSSDEDGKKRVAETSLKTSASDKKAKIATPSGQTTGSSCGNSSSSKAPGNSNSKPKAKSPKPVGIHACKSCSRTFGSDSALQSHEKAKHA